jgi:predicted nucleotidyltransferase
MGLGGPMGKPLTREQDNEQAARDYHDHNLTELDTLNRTLFATIEIMEAKNIPYALIGGVAVKELGRPRITHDIDIFVRPDDAIKVLSVLKERDFHTELRDPFWLYKAWREEVLVDIIFKSSGDIYFDEEVRAHVRRIPYNGKFLNAISPEDFIVIKAAAHQEHNPHHWHDALAVLTQGNLNWDYLLRRAKHAPRRVLALLIYAQANDIAVPTEVIQKLYRSIFESPTYMADSIVHPYRPSHKNDCADDVHAKDSPIYMKGKIIEALTTDERIAEHDIKVTVTDSTIVARGEVNNDEQKTAVDDVVKKMAPQHEFKNLVHVRNFSGPEGSEAIQ